MGPANGLKDINLKKGFKKHSFDVTYQEFY